MAICKEVFCFLSKNFFLRESEAFCQGEKRETGFWGILTQKGKILVNNKRMSVAKVQDFGYNVTYKNGLWRCRLGYGGCSAVR